MYLCHLYLSVSQKNSNKISPSRNQNKTKHYKKITGWNLVKTKVQLLSKLKFWSISKSMNVTFSLQVSSACLPPRTPCLNEMGLPASSLPLNNLQSTTSETFVPVSQCTAQLSHHNILASCLSVAWFQPVRVHVSQSGVARSWYMQLLEAIGELQELRQCQYLSSSATSEVRGFKIIPMILKSFLIYILKS